MNTKPSRSVTWAKAEIAKRESEIADLRAYIRVEMMKAGGGAGSGDDALPVSVPQVSDGWPSAKPTTSKKRMMLQAIADADHGIATQQVIATGIARGFTDMHTGNVSPQLSAYRKLGLLSLNSGIWRITDEGRAWLSENDKGGTP